MTNTPKPIGKLHLRSATLHAQNAASLATSAAQFLGMMAEFHNDLRSEPEARRRLEASITAQLHGAIVNLQAALRVMEVEP